MPFRAAFGAAVPPPAPRKGRDNSPPGGSPSAHTGRLSRPPAAQTGCHLPRIRCWRPSRQLFSVAEPGGAVTSRKKGGNTAREKAACKRRPSHAGEKPGQGRQPKGGVQRPGRRLPAGGCKKAAAEIPAAACLRSVQRAILSLPPCFRPHPHRAGPRNREASADRRSPRAKPGDRPPEPKGPEPPLPLPTWGSPST